MTAADRIIEARGLELERWLESEQSIGLWETLGWLTIGIVLFAIAIWPIGDLFMWAAQSWTRFLLSPFYLAIIVIVAAAFWRVGGYVGALPESVQRALDAALGVVR